MITRINSRIVFSFRDYLLKNSGAFVFDLIFLLSFYWLPAKALQAQ
jgi:hypothetical protein